MSTNVPLPPELWTDERIREAFIYDGGESEHHDPISGAQTQRQVAGSIFDAWLAAHDTALRESLLAPPADVREALIGAAMSVRMTAEGREVYVNRLVAAILASPDFEIHLRGAVTPPADDVREAVARATAELGSGQELAMTATRVATALAAMKSSVKAALTVLESTSSTCPECKGEVTSHFCDACGNTGSAEVRSHGAVTDAERQAVADAIDNAAVITPRNEFLGGSTIANILEVADAALAAARGAQ